METREWRYEDKSAWGEGPWQNEPDKKQWMTKSRLPGLIVRNRGGALCGYVGVPEGHPLHGKGLDDSLCYDLNVHCGLTYSNFCRPHLDNKERGVCHVVENDDDRTWWLGFDCAHSGDLSPKTEVDLSSFPGVYWDRFHKNDKYRDFDYVTEDVERLARQVIETKK